jgi:hypothetical protein
MERLWSLAGATSGNRWQMHEPRKWLNKLKPLPPVATSCRSERMVRRGSTVRVRQRALARGKFPEIGDFCCPTQHHRAPPHYRREGTSARCAACKVPANRPAARYLGCTSCEGGGRQSGSRDRSVRNRLNKRNSAPRSLVQATKGFLGDRSWGRLCSRSGDSECQRCQGRSSELTLASRLDNKLADGERPRTAKNRCRLSCGIIRGNGCRDG